MKSSPIRAAVFDIGMVLLRFDFKRTATRLDGRCRVPVTEIAPLFWERGLVDSYDRGLLSTAAFASEICQRIGFQGTAEELIVAWSDIFTPNEPMIRRVRRWKGRGLPLHLLSNTCESHVDFFTSRFDFFGEFDGAVYSCREGLLKPEPGIYERLIQRHRLDPVATVFIDDRLENVEAARSIGLQACHYTDEEKLTSDLLPWGLD